MKFGCNRPSSFRSRLKLWTDDGRTTDDGRRTTEPAYTISSPGAFGSGELKNKYEDSSFLTLLNSEWPKL